jgi:predicted ATPase
MAVVDHITVKGFKSLQSIEKLRLEAINVLIGANGTGKSNLIGLFEFLRAVREGRLRETIIAEGGANRVLHMGAKQTRRLHVDISFNGETNSYALDLLATKDGGLAPMSEEVRFWNKSSYAEPIAHSLAFDQFEAGISRHESAGIAQYVRGHLAKLRVYHFHDTSSHSGLRSTCRVEDNRELQADGGNLPAILHRAMLVDPDRFNLLVDTVRSIAPFIGDFILAPRELDVSTIRLEWRHAGSDEIMDVASLSDGTLRFIALATVFLLNHSGARALTIVDEPELGLHPAAIARVGAMVKHAAAKSQVFLATQSPLLLDQFEPADVIVAQNSAGRTSLSRLAAEPLSRWLDEFSLGELWEKNHFGGRPGSEILA